MKKNLRNLDEEFIESESLEILKEKLRLDDRIEKKLHRLLKENPIES